MGRGFAGPSSIQVHTKSVLKHHYNALSTLSCLDQLQMQVLRDSVDSIRTARSVALLLLELGQREVVVQGVGDQQAHVLVQRLPVVAHQERVDRLLALRVDLRTQVEAAQ